MGTDRKAYLLEYNKKNYKRVPFDVKIEDYERIKAHAESVNETVNGFIKRAINETIVNDLKPPSG